MQEKLENVFANTKKYPPFEEEHLGNEAIEDVLSQAAAILGNQDAGYDGPGLGK